MPRKNRQIALRDAALGWDCRRTGLQHERPFREARGDYASIDLQRATGTRGEYPSLFRHDELLRAAFRRSSEQGCWDVVEAENGQIALRCLSASRPDVIVLDLMMPEMDGFEFLEELRSRPQWRDIPVVVITAKDLTPEDRRRLNGDVERVVQKRASGLDDMLREVGLALALRVDRRLDGKTAV